MRDGCFISVWEDHLDSIDWKIYFQNKRFDSFKGTYNGEQLIKLNGHSWDDDKLRSTFDMESVEAIKIVTLSITKPDKLAWIADKKGRF